MNCVYCNSDTRVTNSRPQKRTNSIWRRRLCVSCDAIFSTTEVVDYSQSFKFKDDGRLEPFSRDMVLVSINDSLRHRKHALADATALTDTVMSMIRAQTKTAVVDRAMVVETCRSVLLRFDTVAATHYAAFHPVNTKQ